jgi:SpoVK/Ycf46/Vps4 family AAA+-type ATPase
VVDKVQQFIQGQLGEDVVEFKKPDHTLDDVVGFTRLKEFLREELMPRFRASGDRALPGAAVAGPIGSGKTFIFEAVAAELGVPVLVLKNIRSQWYGQTDVIFERLRRVLEALEKVVIFVDEADTQFGGVGQEVHSTERRLTGKIQAMMSDPRLRGRVAWLLMTARIHLLSPDIRRPGRVGDLIIPVLDPAGDDRDAFLRWVARAAVAEVDDAAVGQLDELTKGYSAAAFASLRSQLKAAGADNIEAVVDIVRDHIPPAIGLTRRYQTLQALINCTRRSLLPDPAATEADRELWQKEVRALEAMGIS